MMMAGQAARSDPRAPAFARLHGLATSANARGLIGNSCTSGAS